jgi:hypothetical protein
MARALPSEKALATALMQAATMHDVEQILEIAEKIYGPLAQRPVGDRENNIGTVRLGSDPALGIVERVTNGMDDLLDLGHAEHPDQVPSSPREGARAWLGVPPGGVGDMTDKERRSLGEHLRVWLDESGEDKRPTVVIADDGLGQHPSDFPRTLLSLNESNKVAQPWNMGTYGQGGAVTFGWSRATIILSRRHPSHLDGRSDRVGWTIVSEYENDPTLQMLPSYKYVVTGANEVPTLDPSLVDELDHGTRVIHVGYDLQGWTGPFTTGLWQFFHSALFDPVMPFHLSGKRKKEKNYGSRIIIGNAARLAHPDRAKGDVAVAHGDSVKLVLGPDYGSVTFNYWVLRREGHSTTDPAASYVRADSAVSMTLFGQRQDTESRSWINQQAKLPFLYRNMVVQIDADALTPRAKREVFASTREKATKSDLRALIYEHLASALRGDEELRRLNHEEKERLLQRSTSASSEKVRKRLAKFIKTHLKDVTRPGKGGTSAGVEGRKPTTTGGGTSKPRGTDDKHLPNVPSRLEIVRDAVRLPQGSTGYSWVEIDAKNGYLPAHDDELTFSWEGTDPGNKVRLATRSKLLGGKSRWLFDASPDAQPGNYTFRANLLTENGVLSDAVTLTVVLPPTTKPTDKGTEPETGPKVVWVRREEWPNYAQHGMNARKVGFVTVDEDETIIFVNRHFHVLDTALAGRSLTPEQIDTRATRYQFPVACALWLQNHALATTDPKPSEQYQQQELERMAEAVLVAIDPDVDAALEESEE